MTSAIVLMPVLTGVSPELLAACAATGVEWTFLVGCRDLCFARSILLSRALRSRAHVFAFVDADMCPSSDELTQLCESPIIAPTKSVTGCYATESGDLTLCGMNGRPVIQSQLDSASSIECSAAGLGFAAVHRDAIVMLQKELPTLGTSTGEPWWPFFLSFVGGEIGELGTYFAEDVAFWYRLRTVSTAHLIADTSLRPAHRKRTRISS